MNWLIDHLVIDHWREGWRRWSVKLAAAVGTLSALLLANQSLALSLISYLPANSFARLLCAVSIGLVVFVVPTLAVLWKQGNGDKAC